MRSFAVAIAVLVLGLTANLSYGQKPRPMPARPGQPVAPPQPVLDDYTLKVIATIIDPAMTEIAKTAGISGAASQLQAAGGKEPDEDLETLRSRLSAKEKEAHAARLEISIKNFKETAAKTHAAFANVQGSISGDEGERAVYGTLKASEGLVTILVPKLEAEVAALRGAAQTEVDDDAIVPHVEGQDLTEWAGDAFMQTFFGNYSGAKPNAGGLVGSVLFGLTGVDAPKDVADIVYDMHHWEWSWGHGGSTILDMVGIIPFIGAIKNIKGIKYVDEVADETKAVADATSSTLANVIKNGDTDWLWKMADTKKRGVLIEDALAQTDYRDWYRVGAEANGKFELVDFQKGQTLVSLKSIDTTLPSWQATGREYIRNLAGATACLGSQFKWNWSGWFCERLRARIELVFSPQ